MDLNDLLRVHRQVPMAQGSGATNLPQKCRRVAMTCYFEGHSMPATSAVLRRLRATCGDMGIEMSTTAMQGATVDEMLPSWMQEGEIEQDVAENDAIPIHGKKRDFSLPLAFVSAGCLHIINNMFADVDKELAVYSAWLPGFIALAY